MYNSSCRAVSIKLLYVCLTCSTTPVSQTLIWLNCDFCQLNFGQEHLKCIDAFVQNIRSFVGNNFQVHDERTDESIESDSVVTPSIHYSEDDLRTGPFKYIVTEGNLW